MADWYDSGIAALYEEGAEQTGLTIEQFKAAYSFLSEIGIVDYDIEKDVVFERYCADDEGDE